LLLFFKKEDSSFLQKGYGMQTRHVPTIDRRYWSGIIFASIFGTNLGDFYAHESGLGIGLGLLVLIILFAATYWIETKDRAAHEIYYWLAIIIIRTGATNIADFLAYRAQIPGLFLTCGLAAAIAVLAWSGSGRRTPDDIGVTLATTNLIYWGAMLAAGVFGTVAGDICSHHVGQGPASLGLGAMFAMLLFVAKFRAATSIAIYWCAVALARTAGTSIGDWCAENRILHIGLPLSTLLTGAAFVAILTLWRGGQTDAHAAA
jgi:uncharacterized membrane-anchored protein